MSFTLKYGHPYRSVCWLVRPTAFDMYMPEDFTLEYVLCEPYGVRGRPPRPFFMTIDIEEAQRVSKSCYMSRTAHVILTRWRNPEGHVVLKTPYVKAWKAIDKARSDHTEQS